MKLFYKIFLKIILLINLFILINCQKIKGDFAWYVQDLKLEEENNNYYDLLDKKLFNPSDYEIKKNDIIFKSSSKIWWIYILSNNINFLNKLKATLNQQCKSELPQLIYIQDLKINNKTFDTNKYYISDSFENLASCEYVLRIYNSDELIDQTSFLIIDE